MVFQSWVQFQEDYGERAGRGYVGVREYAGAVAEGVGEMICNLHNTYPDKWFIPPATRGFLTGACAGAGLPVPETNGFGDGQCAEPYYITAKWKVTRRFQTGTFDVGEVLIGDPGITGPVRDIVLDAADEQNVLDFEIFAGTSENARIVRIDQSSGVGYVAGSVEYKITRVDGEPDICLNQGGYPESPPVASGDTTTNITTNTVNKAGDVVSTTNISATYGGDTNVFKFPTTVNVGGNSVTVNFNGFSFGGTGGDASTSESGGEAEGGSNTKTYKKPFDEQDFVLTRPPNADGETPETEEEAEEKEEEEEEAVEVVWVLVTVTTLPPQRSTILHQNAENNSFFAGYFSWVVDAPGGRYRMPEQPLRKTRNAFLSPPEATGYVAFTTNGAKIRVTKFTPKPVED